MEIDQYEEKKKSDTFFFGISSGPLLTYVSLIYITVFSIHPHLQPRHHAVWPLWYSETHS